jgi:hypothetical protein
MPAVVVQAVAHLVSSTPIQVVQELLTRAMTAEMTTEQLQFRMAQLVVAVQVKLVRILLVEFREMEGTELLRP